MTRVTLASMRKLVGCLFAVQLLGMLAAHPVRAQDTPPAAASTDVELHLSDEQLRLELADIDHRSEAATALYVSSMVLLVTGAGGVVGGVVAGVATFGGTNVLPAVFANAGAVCLVGHLITFLFSVGLDIGSGVRRGRFREQHPELAVRFRPGPGGLAIDF